MDSESGPSTSSADRLKKRMEQFNKLRMESRAGKSSFSSLCVLRLQMFGVYFSKQFLCSSG